MAEILQGKLRVAVQDPESAIANGISNNEIYSVLHPETDVDQIVGFEPHLVRTINKIVGDSINVYTDDDGVKIANIPTLVSDVIKVDTLKSNRDEPVNGIISHALGDQDGNNIKSTYATKAELDDHNFTTNHIIDFVENVRGLIDQKVTASGLNAYLPLIGGVINGDLSVNGTLSVRRLDSAPATKTTSGIVKIGNNIEIVNGFITVPQANDEKPGVVKLYQGRGHEIDGAVSQGVLEIALHDAMTICEGLYQLKSVPADRAIHDEYGHRLNEYYLNKEYDKVSQANKLNVEITDSFKEFSFLINDNSYSYTPVEVLKLDDDGGDDSITICTFDNADASSFIYEPELAEDDPFRTVEFDGTMHLVKNYNIQMSALQSCGTGFISYSTVIPLNRFRKRFSITVDTINSDSESTDVIQSIKLFISNGILYATTGAHITDNWNNLTDIERENLILNFRNTANIFTNEMILDLDEVQVIAYTTDNRAQFEGRLNAIPNKKIVMPKGLIPTNSFVSLINVDMDYEIIGKGSIRMAASSDLEH